MEKDFKFIEKLWIYFYSSLQIEPHEYDIYNKIIDKIKINEFNFTKDDKINLLKIINILMLDCDYYAIKNLKLYKKNKCLKRLQCLKF